MGAQINPPLGPYVNPTPADFAQSTSFSTNDLLVATDYFYWYDIYSQAHIRNPDGSDALTDHPASMVDFSYTSSAWHRAQLTNMTDAGIDLLLAVSWGAPSERDPLASANYWSFSGLGPLVAAREELLQERKRPPCIGMFYDTSTLQYNSWGLHLDLTTAYGREWFYESIRDFFSLIPPKHWAMIDGHPIVFLYSSSFAAKYDQTCIDYARQCFARDFSGRTPYIVREISWQVRADNVYQWGGALGLKNPGVATLGPGYNDSAVPGRVPLVVSRDNGDFYKRNWIRFLQNPSKIVVLETWDEFHEGTDIADSAEYGRAYLDLSLQYVQMFRQGIRPGFPRGPFTDVKLVSITLQQTNLESGLYQFDLADGATSPTNVAGRPCRAVAATGYPGRYIYFRVDDSFKWSTAMRADVQVDYFDSPAGTFWLEFDGSDLSAPFQGSYSPSAQTVSLTGSGTWRSALFSLTGAKFLNSQNGGADFRIALSGTQLFVCQVKVIRPGLPEEAGQVVMGFQDDFSGATRSTNWVTAGSGGDVFRQTNGVLKVHATSGGPSQLLAMPAPSPESAQEILARVRIAEFSGGYSALGGVAATLDTNVGSGFQFYFTATSGLVPELNLYDRLLPLQPAQNFPWMTNTWYWVRLRHQTNASAGAADVLAKIWHADGLTSEPPNWPWIWDYFPQHPARTGLAGIIAGSGPKPAELEFDYFLLKSPSLPSITARLPVYKPAQTTLRVFRSPSLVLEIDGEPGGAYLIEASTNLVTWQGETAVVLTNGTARLNVQPSTLDRDRFYRARFLQ